MRTLIGTLLVLCLAAGGASVAIGYTEDDAFTAIDPETTTYYPATYLVPGEVVLAGEAGGFIELCHYPDKFLMADDGGFLAGDGSRGFRAMGPDGQTGGIFGVSAEEAYIAALPDFMNVPKSLLLATGDELELQGVPEPEAGKMRVILNGRPVLISFVEE